MTAGNQNWPFESPESCPALDWLKNSLGLARWGLPERRDWTGSGSALLILKVSRLSLSFFWIWKSGLGGRGTSFKEIPLISCSNSLSYICGGLSIFLYEIALEFNGSFCEEYPFNEKGELDGMSLSVLKLLLVFQGGCCDADGWNVGEFHCWYNLFCWSECNALLNCAQNENYYLTIHYMYKRLITYYMYVCLKLPLNAFLTVLEISAHPIMQV